MPLSHFVRLTLQFSAPKKIRFIVPVLRNPDFLDRKAVFGELERCLILSDLILRRAELCGLGGIGRF